MKRSFSAVCIVVIVATCCLTTGLAQAAEVKAPATAAAKVIATVGKATITSDQIDRAVARYAGKVPPAQLARVRKRMLDQMIEQKLMAVYLDVAPCSDADLAAEKEKFADALKKQNVGMSLEAYMASRNLTDAMLRDYVSQQHLMKKMDEVMKETSSSEKVDALLKSAPVSRFDGTQVQASHVLITSDFYASAAEKKKARARLAEVARAISDKKISFADAARKYSGCPSGVKGGDLGKFTYSRMVLPFSQVAFGMKVGQISGIVETRFGFHIIKVTGRTEGSGKAGPDARATAARMLETQARSAMLRKALETTAVAVKVVK